MESEPTIKGELRAELSGKVVLPLVLIAGYGVYRMVRQGLVPNGVPHGYLLIAGAVLSAIVVAANVALLSEPSEPSWRRSIVAFGGLLPYVFLIYVMIYLGVIPVIAALRAGFDWWGLLFGLIWGAVGYRALFGFWTITELLNARPHPPK